LTHRLLSTAYSLPTGEARPRAVLKTVILFITEYGCAAYDKREKEMRLAYWKAMVFAARSWKWESSSETTALIFAS
jgi:hypothetical protein